MSAGTLAEIPAGFPGISSVISSCFLQTSVAFCETASRLRTLLAGDFCALLASFRQSDRYRLLFTGNFLSGAAGRELAALHFVHRFFHGA